MCLVAKADHQIIRNYLIMNLQSPYIAPSVVYTQPLFKKRH